MLWLKEWEEQKLREMELIRKVNQQETEAKNQRILDQMNGSNPWDRVVENVEINANLYVGGKDVTRMRQAMLARRADITKQGGLVSE